MLDHETKTVEVGRGAIAKAWQRRGIPAMSIGPMRALLATVPEYAVIIDATTLARGAKATADAVGAPAVALHPSNFTVQPGSVDGWHGHLEQRRGPELAHALLRRQLSRALERAGAILGGVIVDAHGSWRASYTLLTTPEHDAQVRRDLEVLVDHAAMDSQTMPLLRLVHAHANHALEQAA